MAKSTAEKIEKALQKGNFSPVYLLTGEDLFRKKELIDKIIAAVNPDDFNRYSSSADKANMGEVLALANTAPVFSAKRLVVLTGIEKLRKNPKEALLHYLENPLESTVFILTHNDSKKMKTEKTLAALAAEHGETANLDELKRDDLAQWIRNRFAAHELQPEPDAIEILCETVGSDLYALAQEIEKLALYTAERTVKKITQEDVLCAVGFSKEENPFELSNAIEYLNKNKALALIDKLLDSGEAPVSVLSKISYPLLKMARIKSMTAAGMSPADISRAAGLMFWENALINRASSFPCEQTFLKTLDRLIEADKAFKTSQVSDPKIRIKGIIMTFFSK